MKIAIAQMDIAPGHPNLNCSKMLDLIQKAKNEDTDIIIFPEMSIPGYLLGDMWEQISFLKDCEKFGQDIINASNGICVMFGNVAVDWDKINNDGRPRKYNAFFTAKDGKLCGGDNFMYPFRIKTLQPNYREFDDDRHFFSLTRIASQEDFSVDLMLAPVHINIKGKDYSVGCILCEDGWSDDYYCKPIHTLSTFGVDFYVNISCSPFTLGKNLKRNRIFSKQVNEVQVPLFYVNNVGLQNNGKTVYTFDGCSTVYNNNGDIVFQSSEFKETLEYVDFETINSKPVLTSIKDDNIETIYKSLVYGIENFTKNIGINKIVIGASGGIDSALSAALYVKVLGPERVVLVNMPSKYNSQTTKDLAFQLAQNLGCKYYVLPIEDSVKHTVSELHDVDIYPSSLVIENIQARDRSSRVLASVAASLNAVFTNNGNKSEMTVGYCTLYGDVAGFLAAIGDLWKHQVYQLSDYVNKEIYKREVIPQGTIDIIPSAELSQDQAVDQGKGDPIIYPYHDFLFRAFVERWNRATPEDILEWYSDGTLEEQIGCEKGIVDKIFKTRQDFVNDLERWWKLYTGMGVAKRIQSPPVLAVSRRAFGFDHREAQNGVYFTTRYLELKEKLLIK
jgi:NAD+ synthase (glutamine-hydrolysing)